MLGKRAKKICQWGQRVHYCMIAQELCRCWFFQVTYSSSCISWWSNQLTRQMTTHTHNTCIIWFASTRLYYKKLISKTLRRLVNFSGFAYLNKCFLGKVERKTHFTTKHDIKKKKFQGWSSALFKLQNSVLFFLFCFAHDNRQFEQVLWVILPLACVANNIHVKFLIQC